MKLRIGEITSSDYIYQCKIRGYDSTLGEQLGARITRPMCELAHLGRGDKVIVEVTKNGLSVRPMKEHKRFKLPYLEKDLLEGMTRHKAHAEEVPIPLATEIED